MSGKTIPEVPASKAKKVPMIEFRGAMMLCYPERNTATGKTRERKMPHAREKNTQEGLPISQVEAAQMFKALGDGTRLRMLGLLRHDELCVCDIMEVLKLPQSTASRHLAYLRNSRWVRGTRRGKWMYYRLREDTFEHPVARSIMAFLDSLEQLREDQRMLGHHLQSKSGEACE